MDTMMCYRIWHDTNSQTQMSAVRSLVVSQEAEEALTVRQVQESLLGQAKVQTQAKGQRRLVTHDHHHTHQALRL